MAPAGVTAPVTPGGWIVTGRVTHDIPLLVCLDAEAADQHTNIMSWCFWSLPVLSLIVFAGCAAEPRPSEASTPARTAAPATADRPLKAPGEAAIGDRTSCPTSGEEFVVTGDSPKVEYQGKTYYFCCAGCDKKFAKDPEKYLKKPSA